MDTRSYSPAQIAEAFGLTQSTLRGWINRSEPSLLLEASGGGWRRYGFSDAVRILIVVRLTIHLGMELNRAIRIVNDKFEYFRGLSPAGWEEPAWWQENGTGPFLVISDVRGPVPDVKPLDTLGLYLLVRSDQKIPWLTTILDVRGACQYANNTLARFSTSEGES